MYSPPLYFLCFQMTWRFVSRMVVNTEKMQVVHFRPPRKPITQHELHFGEDTLHVVSEYKYIGVYLDGHMLLNSTAICLSGAASHALEAIRYRLKFLKEWRSSTFTTLYSSCVCPISDYVSGVLEWIQGWAIRYFLGVHRFAPIHMLCGDIGWVPCNIRQIISC